MLAEEVQDRPEALDLVVNAQRAQERLTQLYEEVRQYAAPIRLAVDRQDIQGIWREAWEHLTAARQEKHLRLVEIDGEAGSVCEVDRVRVGQVMLNIFENAIQASPPGAVIQVQCKNIDISGDPALEVAIRDQGPGSTLEQRQRILEPFYTTKTKGTGLGMAIVHRIVHASWRSGPRRGAKWPRC